MVDKIKTLGEPLVVVSNGKPDVVVMDGETYNVRIKRLQELETEYLLRIAGEAEKEYKSGKTIRLKKDQTLMDLIN